MLIAALSTLISSIALVAVAISLLLQARQLRASQIQAARASQVELIKFALSDPTIAMELAGVRDSEEFVKNMQRNWYVSHLSLSYDSKAVSRAQLRHLASLLFSAEGSRKWWEAVGDSYRIAATSRRDKEFFTILDTEFRRVSPIDESVNASEPEPPTASGKPPPPSS